MPESAAGKGDVLKVIISRLGWRVAVGSHFFEHHIHLTRQLVGRKYRVHDQVGNQLHGPRQMLGRKH